MHWKAAIQLLGIMQFRASVSNAQYKCGIWIQDGQGGQNHEMGEDSLGRGVRTRNHDDASLDAKLCQRQPPINLPHLSPTHLASPHPSTPHFSRHHV